MLSGSLFKAELDAYRASMRPYKPGAGGSHNDAADLQIIDRWIKHPDRETIWKTIWRAAPDDLQATEFIKTVIRAKRKAVGIENQVFGVTVKERSSAKVRVFEPDREFERPISRQEKKDWAAIKKRLGVKRLAIPKTVRVVQGTLSEPRVVDFDPVHFAGLQEEWTELKKKLSGNLSEPNIEILAKAYDLHIAWQTVVGELKISRQDEGGTRVLRLFWQIVGDYLQARCNRLFDKQVAALTEIAFGFRQGTIFAHNISDARKPRSKTAH